MPARSGGDPGILETLPPRIKWRAILFGTLAFMPAYWGVLIGVVAGAAEEPTAPNSAASLALGLALIPFVFIVLAFASQHPRAPGAVLKAMGLSLLVGVPASALAGDIVTGLIAGMGAGGIVALRAERDHETKYRVLAVIIAAAYAFLLVRVADGVALLTGPVLPFTAIGVADHLAERRRERSEGAEQR